MWEWGLVRVRGGFPLLAALVRGIDFGRFWRQGEGVPSFSRFANREKKTAHKNSCQLPFPTNPSLMMESESGQTSKQRRLFPQRRGRGEQGEPKIPFQLETAPSTGGTNSSSNNDSSDSKENESADTANRDDTPSSTLSESSSNTPTLQGNNDNTGSLTHKEDGDLQSPLSEPKNDSENRQNEEANRGEDSSDEEDNNAGQGETVQITMQKGMKVDITKGRDGTYTAKLEDGRTFNGVDPKALYFVAKRLYPSPSS